MLSSSETYICYNGKWKEYNVIAPGAEFKPLPDDHPTRQSPRLITPKRIIVHWSDAWSDVYKTYWTFVSDGTACQFAIDENIVLQIQRLAENIVEMPRCATGADQDSINIEMTGKDFSKTNLPPEAEMQKTIDLICWLKDKYGINTVEGHYQVTPGKSDPGKEFFEEVLMPRINAQCPTHASSPNLFTEIANAIVEQVRGFLSIFNVVI
jgi:hypothetical protein